jgi:hypothetical protein
LGLWLARRMCLRFQPDLLLTRFKAFDLGVLALDALLEVLRQDVSKIEALALRSLIPRRDLVDAWWFLFTRRTWPGCVEIETHDTLRVELADGFHLLSGLLPPLLLGLGLGLEVVAVIRRLVLDSGCIIVFVVVWLRFDPLGCFEQWLLFVGLRVL